MFAVGDKLKKRPGVRDSATINVQDVEEVEVIKLPEKHYPHQDWTQVAVTKGRSSFYGQNTFWIDNKDFYRIYAAETPLPVPENLVPQHVMRIMMLQ